MKTLPVKTEFGRADLEPALVGLPQARLIGTLAVDADSYGFVLLRNCPATPNPRPARNNHNPELTQPLYRSITCRE